MFLIWISSSCGWILQHSVQSHEPLQWTVGATTPRHVAVHSPGPQFMLVPVQAEPGVPHSRVQEASPQRSSTSPQASIPPSHLSVHA